MTPSSAGSVLVVDDEPVVRDVLSRYLMREGYAVMEAADGEQALATIRSDPPNVVVLDLMLPRLSGLDVLKLVRLESDLPVIILSARVVRVRAHQRASARRRRLHRQALLAARGRRARTRRLAPAGGQQRRRRLSSVISWWTARGGEVSARRRAGAHDPQGVRTAVPAGHQPGAHLQPVELLEDCGATPGRGRPTRSPSTSAGCDRRSRPIPPSRGTW